MDVPRAKTLVGYVKEKRECEKRLKYLNGRIAEISEEVGSQMIDEEVHDFTVDGMRISAAPFSWAKKLAEDDVVAAACEEAGLGEMVYRQVNGNSLSARIRRMLAKGEPMPEQFEGVIEIRNKLKLGFTAQS